MDTEFHTPEKPTITDLPPHVSKLVDPAEMVVEKLTSWWTRGQRVQELDEFCDAQLNVDVFGKLMNPIRDVISLALRIEAVSSDPFSPHRTWHLWTSLIGQLGCLLDPILKPSLSCESIFVPHSLTVDNADLYSLRPIICPKDPVRTRALRQCSFHSRLIMHH